MWRSAETTIESMFSTENPGPWCTISHLLPAWRTVRKSLSFIRRFRRERSRRRHLPSALETSMRCSLPSRKYVRNFAFSSYVMKTPGQIDEKQFQSRKLSLAETAAAIGSYRIWIRDYPEGLQITEE